MKTPRLSMVCSTFTLLASGAALAVPLTGVPNPNPKTPGFSAPNGLSPELTEAIVAQGSIPLENPATVTDGGNAVNLSPRVPSAGKTATTTERGPSATRGAPPATSVSARVPSRRVCQTPGLPGVGPECEPLSSHTGGGAADHGGA